MAHFDSILEDVKLVADELGQFFTRRSGRERYAVPADDQDTEPHQLEIAETITVWQLTLKALDALKEGSIGGDVINWVEQQPFLHHQIRLRGKTAAFARSYRKLVAENEETRRTLFHVSSDSSYASLLTTQFERIDQNANHDPFLELDPVVRLLEIPSFQVYVLWLFSASPPQSRLMVLTAAKRFTELTPGASLTPEAFWLALRRGPLRDVI